MSSHHSKSSKTWVSLLALALLFSVPQISSAAVDDEVIEQKNLFEVGAYLGAYLPPSWHELYDMDVGHRSFDDAALAFGLRLSYLPRAYVGVELEAGVMPISTVDDKSATLIAARAHVIALYPARVAPFFVIGTGVLAVSSDDSTVGNDFDMAFHWGVGVKWYATDSLALRADARQLVSGRRGVGGRESHFELLAGISWVIGWEKLKDSDGDGLVDKRDKCPAVAAKTKDGCPPPDADGDGVIDAKDKCPKIAAQTEDGCPPPDTDGDGMIDAQDKCPKIAAKTEDGCPPKDTDHDGILDKDDKCPTEPAKTKDGCPLKDSDGDGIVDEKDQCPKKAETKNGFKDGDGCPDELPKAVKRFTGAIKGIYFANNKADIKKRSFKTLDGAVKVLAEFKSLKLQVRGHSDNRGKREYNLDLSKRRAQAVRDYFVQKGIAAERLLVEGVGPDEPIADNKKAKGRAKNRRIEFKIVTK